MSLSKDITINEIKTKKSLLETKILSLIQEFEYETKTKICNINYFINGNEVRNIITKVDVGI